MLTLDEFKKQVYHTRTNIIIPSLNRMSIEKINFMRRGKFKQQLLDDYLNELYKNVYK